MRRLSAAVTCILLAPALGGLAACTSSDGTQPTSTTAPLARQAGPAAATADSLGPGKLAMFLLEGVLQGVGAQGYNFLSDLLFGSGDVTAAATTEKLDAIQSQLDTISTRLDALDSDVDSIKGQMAGDVLSAKLDSMNTWNNKMTTLYEEYFRPIATAAKTVSVAKKNIADAQNASCVPSATSTPTATSTPSATGTTASGPTAPATSSAAVTCSPTATVSPDLTLALSNSVQSVVNAKSLFETAFIAADPFTTMADQHDALYPKDPNVFSVLKLAGQSLESKNYATWTDSQRLAAVYLPLSDQEALTALLILEHDKMFGADAATQQRHRDEYVSNNAVEKANLPPEIPWAQVKLGTRMFKTPAYPQDTVASHGAWLPITAEGRPLSTYTPRDTETANPGWVLPTAAQLGTLYDATKSTPIVESFWGTPSTHLGSIWQNSGRLGTYGPPRGVSAEAKAIDDFGKTWYWTSDTSASNPMDCDPYQDGQVSRTYTLHHVGNMAGATAFETQGQPGRIPDFFGGGMTVADCDNSLVTLYNNDTYSAYVMLTQPIPADVDYLAQRSTALPAPATPTPTS